MSSPLSIEQKKYPHERTSGYQASHDRFSQLGAMMNNKLKCAVLLTGVVLLGACVGPQATFKERFQDNFAHTAAKRLSPEDQRCIMVSNSYTMTSGSMTFSIPAGRYISQRSNGDGAFYYAPTRIKSSNWLLIPDQLGIYLNNQHTHGYLFGTNPEGFDDRPVRGVVLPGAVLGLIRNC